jgi:ferritin-like protein
VSDVIQWIKEYYVDPQIQNPEEIKKKINMRKAPGFIYLLTFPANPENVMEIVPAILLRQHHMYENCRTVFGMAYGKDQAIALAAAVLEECYRESGSFRVDEYLKNR